MHTFWHHQNQLPLFVPGTEDDGDVAEGFDKVGPALEPDHEFVVFFSAGEDGFHHLVGGDIPGVAAGDDVVRVPGEGDHAAAFNLREGGLADQAEGHAVQVLIGPMLDVSEVEADHGGILSGDGFHVRAFQGVGFPVFHAPGMTVGEVVLMGIGNLPFGD